MRLEGGGLSTWPALLLCCLLVQLLPGLGLPGTLHPALLLHQAHTLHLPTSNQSTTVTALFPARTG